MDNNTTVVLDSRTYWHEKALHAEKKNTQLRQENDRLRQERDRLAEEFAAYRATSEEHVTSLINGRRESFNRAKVAESENARLRALLRECAGYLDYMEDRGYSSVRMLRSDVRAALDGGKPK